MLFRSLSYSVRCTDEELKKEIIFELETWIKTIKQPNIISLWKEFRGAQWFLCLMLLFFYVLATPSNTSHYIDSVKEDVNQIVTNGVNQDNIHEAIEIMFTLQTKTYPKVNLQDNKIFFKILGITMLICLILSFPPKTYIGLGLAEDKIKNWQNYLKFVFVSIPALVILPIIVTKLAPFLDRKSVV